MSRISEIVSGTILVLYLSTPATAAIVHKWTDVNGITHYSDEAPAVDSGIVTRIDMPANGIADKTPDNYYSITNQWRRLHRERIEREKLALERARQQAAQLQQTTEVVYADQPARKGYRVIYANPKHRHYGYHRSHYSHGHRNHKGKRRTHGAAMKRNRSSIGTYRQRR